MDNKIKHIKLFVEYINDINNNIDKGECTEHEINDLYNSINMFFDCPENNDDIENLSTASNTSNYSFTSIESMKSIKSNESIKSNKSNNKIKLYNDKPELLDRLDNFILNSYSY